MGSVPAVQGPIRFHKEPGPVDKHMILHTYFRSSAAFRVRIGLNLKGLAYEPRYFHLGRGEHTEAENRAVNPQGLVPTLIKDGRPFIQSLAILEYLEEIHPRPPLLPDEPADRAFVRALAQIVNADCLVIGCSVNTAALTEEEAAAYLAETEARLGLPCVDPFRHGADRLIDALV